MELSFANTEGRGFTINLDQLVRAFLDLSRDGLLPEVAFDWIDRVERAIRARGEVTMDHIATYAGLRRVVQAMCECCGAECHAIFVKDAQEYAIERWSVVSSVMLLIERKYLPRLPFQWHVEMERNYERVCETGRRHWQGGASGAEDV